MDKATSQLRPLKISSGGDLNSGVPVYAYGIFVDSKMIVRTSPTAAL